MDIDFKSQLLKFTGAQDCTEMELIQSLWSGYGKLSRYQLVGAQLETVVVKCISLGAAQKHPRGWDSDFGHQRKVKSYEVETHWYAHYNQDGNAACRTPQFIGSYVKADQQWIVLEDLDLEFPLRRYDLSLTEVKVCLSWLAHFHNCFLGFKPNGLWEVGTYWNLATRPEEFQKIADPELKAKAHLIDATLNACKYQTLVHGDAKLANFCFSSSSDRVAAVDFQYVGGGCGMKDVAYFLGSCLSSEECEMYEEELLGYYFEVFQAAFDPAKHDFDFAAVKKEWLDLYPVACTDFTRFMFGWMPSHQKLNAYSLKMMKTVLAKFS